MKTFKQHVKEGSDKTAAAVGSQTTNSVEDSALGPHNIQDPDVLKRVNAFVGSIAEREYMRPQFAIDELREKLQRIGLTVSPVDMEGDNGKVTAEVKQFVGRSESTRLNSSHTVISYAVFCLKKKKKLK